MFFNVNFAEAEQAALALFGYTDIRQLDELSTEERQRIKAVRFAGRFFKPRRSVSATSAEQRHI